MLKFQKRKVNDVVFAFCWQCRYPKPQYAATWPFILHNWKEHMVDYATSRFGHIQKARYDMWETYAAEHYVGNWGHYISLLNTTQVYTSDWVDEQFEYADYLFRKYYNVGEPLK